MSIKISKNIKEKEYHNSDVARPKILKNKIQIWNDEYNNLEHCGLNGKTLIEMLQLFKLKKVS